MDVKKIELTGEQIKDIFNAGYRVGEGDACAYEWGCASGNGKKDDELAWALTDILGCTIEVAGEIIGALGSA